jgi:RNA polymerase sigma-70 factor (ECF subfamily)
VDDLTLRLRDGDAAAFRALVCAEQDRLVRVAHRLLGDREAALDAAQDAFVRLWRARIRLDPERPPHPFLMRTLRNVCIDRARESAPKSEELDEDLAADRRTPEAVCEDGALAAAVRDAVLSLPEAQRAVFILTHYEGLTYAEAARLLECPAGTVASRKQAALLALRRKLAGWGEER